MKRLLLDIARWLLIAALCGGFGVQIAYNLTS